MNRISGFIDDFIPKNLPEKKRSVLKNELESHLYDKVDFYREIGYGEEESEKKAIADFGTDEEMKNNIFKEFEELYSEKNIYGILSFFGILIMNFLCLPLDSWVTSADFHADPTPLTALISFGMIFAVSGLIIFARVKKYRKMLISTGIANFVIGGASLLNFYSQCSVYSMGHNLVYLIDVFTPVSIGDYIVYGDYNVVSWVVCEAIPFVFALYCFILAAKIKRGTAKNIVNPKKRLLIFTVVFSIIAILTCCLLPAGLAYVDDYKIWFSEYDNHISDESENIFESISIGDSYYDVSNMLILQGYTTAKAYEDTLDRIELKQFRNDYEKFSFKEGYEIWFKTDKKTSGNGFVGLKQEKGTITAKEIGNLNKEMYNEKKSFGYIEEFNHDIFAVVDYFGSLKKGDEESVVLRSLEKNSTVYTKSFSLENGVEKHYYRIFCYGIVNPEAKQSYERNDRRYIELSFEDGRLTSGAMYSGTKSDQDISVKYVK